jgi:hypothetical protein
MADLVVTGANVKSASGAKIEVGRFGATVTAGQTVVKDPLTRKFVPADANHATPELRRPRGIALNPGSLDQTAGVQYEGDVTISAAVAVGTIYVQSGNVGCICPAADLAAGHEVTVIGVGISATQIALRIHNSKAVVPA